MIQNERRNTYMATREEKVANLTDQQALSIVDSLAGEFADAETPEGKTEQASALDALFAKQGESVDVSEAAEADPAEAAAAARQLLVMMARVPQMQPSLDEWLDHPPTQEAAAVPLVLAAPVVLAGCIALLYVVGHVRFKRDASGWEVEYDPSKETPMDESMKDIVGTLAGVMSSMTTGG
jgi:hypothetical protein